MLFQSEEVKNKIKKTSLNRYGTIHPFLNKEIQDRQNSTMISRYGHAYSRQCNSIVKKM